ncbi:MAG: hypothetical protein R3F20_13745 [Planctomycetota bacterium]
MYSEHGESLGGNHLLTVSRATTTSSAAAASVALRDKGAALSEYERMADTRRLANALQAADSLWPEHPDLIPRLEAWLTEYAPLFERLAGRRAAIEGLRAHYLPYSEDDRRRDFAEEWAQIAALVQQLDQLRATVASVEESERAPLAAEVSRLEAEIEHRREATRGRRTWDFGDDIDR